jgi:tetratricopeptide (TPR) repeat protein
MGLNTGLVVVGKIGDNLRMDYTAVGDTTHLAARLQQLAEPGTILVSDATRRLVQTEVLVEAVGPLQVKGKTEPIMAYTVVALGPRRSRFGKAEGRTLTPFVGRQRELAHLQELLAQAEGGRGQVVGIVGEPGVGKSRFLYEFHQSLAGRRVTYLEGRCLSYGGAIPYLPVLDILRENCGITDTDTPEAIAEKVRFGLQEVGMNPEEWAPYLLHLVGVKEGTAQLAVLSPEAIKTRTFETLRQMSLKGSRRRPLIFVVEDLHWIDKTSEDYSASLVESLAGAPILLLASYRPGYRPPWLEKSYATQMALRPLSPPDSLKLVQSTLQRETFAEPVAQVILGKAEGNPFFLEELTRAVEEHGGLGPSLAVPDTIQEVLMARIDRLPDEPKRLLQTASVLGREFSLRLLGAIWEGPGGLEAHLRELTRLEFLYEQSGGEEPVYVFKHALTQDVAYESLLTSRRGALHAAAGQAIERLFADRLEEVDDRLAHHYSKTDQSGKAAEYLTRFAEKAARAYAHAEAVAALEEAFGHLERLPSQGRDRHLIDLLLRQARSFYFLGRFQETLDLLLPQEERLAQLGDPSLSSPYYFWLGHAFSYLGDQERAAQSAQRALEEAKRSGDAATIGRAYHVLTRVGFWSGQPLQVIEHGRQGVLWLERTEERYWLGMIHWFIGFNYFLMGEFDAALEAEARAHAIGEAIGDPRLRTFSAWTTGIIYAAMGEGQAGIEACQRGLQLSPDPVNTTAALGFLGYAYLESGDSAHAIPVLEQAVQQLGQFRFRQLQGWFTAWLSEAYLLNGQIEKARELAVEGLELTRKIKYWWGVGLAQRALGRIAQASGALSDTETHLTEALQAFALIQARFEVGRIHLALAELAHTRGNHEAVTTHLQEAHQLFRTLKVPRYIVRTEQLAKEFKVPRLEGTAP